ncbi:MAG: GCN5-related N-acetyltransferase [Blastococcus sp.]|jgi:diamine N-acetyltransferase|nr:GCN5-related N-acetyltransferase [Blastococcus sp.]
MNSDLRAASPARGAVHLEPLTPENIPAVCARVAPAQESFVEPNAVSVAEAYVHEQAWCRAVRAGTELVGFVMLHDVATGPGSLLWRLMIDARFQGRGFGGQAVHRVIDHVRARPGATQLTVSVHPGEGSPGPFYEALGFLATGERSGGEPVYARPL